MKTNVFNAFARPVVTVALLMALPVMASKAPHVEALKKSLKAVPVLEMPAKAAQLVSEASATEQESVALAVVVAAAQSKPAAIAPVVGAVVRVVPEMAPSIAAAAVAQQPKQAGAITRAAVAAAPSQAGKIVRAVCKQAPAKYDEVAMAAVQTAPAASSDIAAAVSSEVALAKTQIPKTTLAAQAPLAGPPVVLPPFTSLPPSPTEIGSGNTVVVPPGGGRDYASP